MIGLSLEQNREKTGCIVIYRFLNTNIIVYYPPSTTTDAAGAQNYHYPEEGTRLAGPAVLQEVPGSCYLPAMLHPAHEGQTGAEEAEDRGPLGGALQEAQHWHGEQDHAAAAQGG